MLVLVGCGGGNDGADKAGNAAKTGSTVPPTNPAVLRRTPASGGHARPQPLNRWRVQILRDVFEGLTAMGPDGAPCLRCELTVSRMASNTASPFARRTALVERRHLVAADFAAGMRRLVDPRTAGPRAASIGTHAEAITRVAERSLRNWRHRA
jgi:hypothetical protein